MLSAVLLRINDLRVAGKHIVINSTVMPGYINGTATFLLRDCKGCSVSYNPAFVAQGEVMRGYRTGGFFHMVPVKQQIAACHQRKVSKILIRASRICRAG